MGTMRGRPVTLFVCGDVMLGRGIDQILPHPGDPALREAHLRDARAYVELAERANGPDPPAGRPSPGRGETACPSSTRSRPMCAR